MKLSTIILVRFFFYLVSLLLYLLPVAAQVPPAGSPKYLQYLCARYEDALKTHNRIGMGVASCCIGVT